MQATLSILRRARTAHLMSLPKHHQLPPGTPVNIVLKADQRTGKLTSGHVADVLTRGDHPRGVKVRLSDGRVGRVQSLGEGGTGGAFQREQQQQQHYGQGGYGGGAAVGELAYARGEGSDGFEGGGGRGKSGGGGGMRGGKMQDDVRNDPVPVEERSLEEYIKVPSRNKGKKGRKGGGVATASTTNIITTTATATEGTAGLEGDRHENGEEREGLGMGMGTDQGEDGSVRGEKGDTIQRQLEGEFPRMDSALIAAIVADHGEMVGAREVLNGLS